PKRAWQLVTLLAGEPGIDRERQHVLPLVARVLGPQPTKRAKKECGHHQQHERQADLRRDEHVIEPAALTAAADLALGSDGAGRRTISRRRASERERSSVATLRLARSSTAASSISSRRSQRSDPSRSPL